jgi:hypothetical protein
MKLKAQIFVWLFILTSSLSACAGSTPPPAATLDNRQDRLSTAVAGTLTAAAPAATELVRPAATSTATPEPTRQPGPLRVVYSRAGSIWVWTEGGERKQLTNNIVDARPRLSDDGQWIVFERNNELYKVRPDGSDLKVLVSDAFLKPYLPSGYKFIWAEYYDWKPNSHFVYFTTKTGISGWKTDIFQYDLFRADADTSVVSQILPPGNGGVPYFTQDGRSIGLMQPKAIILTDDEGRKTRKALDYPTVYGNEVIYFPFLHPISDNSGFRVMIPSENWLENPNAKANIWIIPIEGKPSLVNSTVQGLLTYYALSMNGKAMGFNISDNLNSFQPCVIYDLDSNQSAKPDFCLPVQTRPAGFLNWAPDNKKFVYHLSGESHQADFYLVSENKVSTEIETNYFMKWIDANRYLFASFDGNLFLASVDGNQIWLDKGVNVLNGVGTDYWYWPFDFSY